MKITWLGHDGFRIESDAGTVLLIDPWIDNPLATDQARGAAEHADAILITHGHGDHMGNLSAVAETTGAPIVCIHEIAVYLESLGLANETLGMNKGGTLRLKDSRITMVHADHSSSIHTGEGLIAGGDAVGFVVRFDTDSTIYHAGDTGLFGDMALIGELYRPAVALIPIGDRYTMGPAEAAYAVGLLRPRTVIPMHYRTFPLLSGTLQEFRDILGPAWADRVIAPAVGKPVQLPPGDV